MKENQTLIKNEFTIKDIKNLIYTIRGKQIMLDSDVAMLYHYETKNVNKAVKRNIERFPDEFYFQLTANEFQTLRLQIGNSKQNFKINDEFKGKRKYLPYVFTEQGIAMLAGIFKNDITIKISVNIIKSFIEMQKFIFLNEQVFERLTNLENKLLEYNKKFNEIFNQLQLEENITQRIFFDGQIYDAYTIIIDIIKKAKLKIFIIDNYIDDNVLKMLTKKKKNVEVIILTSNKSNIENLDIQKFNKEYPILKVSKTSKFHDRFIIIDNKEMYHLGASIKDLGKKCFAINRIEDIEIIDKMTNYKTEL